MSVRILVGLSGGVDSSVSAALLVEGGHDVEGVFLKVWSDEDVQDPLIDCPWERDLADARAVAEQLKIPLHVISVQREYFARVVERMKAGYAVGETPNPDVLCNSEIKFGMLYDWARANQYDYLATGHYARTKASYQLPITSDQLNPSESVPSDRNQSPNPSLETGSWTLATARDELKDQTYFLWRIPRERLEHILFPIGHLQKSEVRELASHFSLLTAKKPDSQGICFLGHVNVHDWLKRELKTRPGDVVDRSGRVVGHHEGVELATIGQRRQLGISGGGPVYYVVEKHVATNTLIVDTKPAVMGTVFDLAQPNWLVDGPLSYQRVEARIRHQGERIPCVISSSARNLADQLASSGSLGKGLEMTVHHSCLPAGTARFTIHLDRPAFAIAPGQSVVLYSDTTVLGGGIISKQ